VTFSGMSLAMWGTLLGSVAAVITLMYLLRLRRRRVEVPFGPLWQQVLTEKRSNRLFRMLRRIFSLLVQILVVALLLTAIAKPEWTGNWGVSEAEPATQRDARHTLLIVDTSASMAAQDGPTNRLMRAQKEAKRVLDNLPSDERVLLATMARDTVALTEWTENRTILQDTLATLSVQHTGTNVNAMTRFARFATQALTNARVVLFTDQAFPPVAEPAVKSLDLHVLSVGASDSSDNLAILDFKVRSHLGNALQYALYYKLKNYASVPVDVGVYLLGDEQGKATTRADFEENSPLLPPVYHQLGPGEERVFEREEIDLPGSRVALMIRPKTTSDFIDVLPIDDVAFATVPQRRDVRVQLVGPGNLFLHAALETASNVTVSPVSLPDYVSTKGYDLTVFDRVVPSSKASGNVLYVNGKGEQAPFKVLGDVKGGALRVPASVRTHPLMRFVKFVDLAATPLQRLRRRKGDRIMARDRKGNPAILAHTDTLSRWIAIGFDPVATEWVGHYSFSIFFMNAINWFFSEDVRMQPPQSLAREWQIRLPWSGVDSVGITTPKGTKIEALVDRGSTLAYTGSEVGLYRVQPPEDNQEPFVIAASLASVEESQLDARGQYPAWEAEPVAVSQDEVRTLLDASLWQQMVLLAMLILLVEWFTYHRRWTA